jgi:hypothetical protein
MKNSEHQQQVQIMKWLALQHPKAYLHTFAVPNGGQRHIRVAAKLKAEGVKAGVPDFMIALPMGGYHGLFIEYKAEKGRPTKTQLEWLARLGKAGYRAALCKGFAAAQEEINEYLATGDKFARI